MDIDTNIDMPNTSATSPSTLAAHSLNAKLPTLFPKSHSLINIHSRGHITPPLISMREARKLHITENKGLHCQVAYLETEDAALKRRLDEKEGLLRKRRVVEGVN
jgi:hypothetical protein